MTPACCECHGPRCEPQEPCCEDCPVTPASPATPPAAPPCWMPCDADCEVGPVHCGWWHEPNHKPGWHDPRECRLPDAAAPPASGPQEAATPGQADGDPFGGHEFAYESHSDLFRCVRCHVYEVVARADGPIKPCTGRPPEGAEPIEVNAW